MRQSRRQIRRQNRRQSRKQIRIQSRRQCRRQSRRQSRRQNSRRCSSSKRRSSSMSHRRSKMIRSLKSSNISRVSRRNSCKMSMSRRSRTMILTPDPKGSPMKPVSWQPSYRVYYALIEFFVLDITKGVHSKYPPYSAHIRQTQLAFFF